MATPQSIRHLNEMQVLDTLLQHKKGLSRAELARCVGLNRSSIGSVVAGLLGEGLVREKAASESPLPAAVSEAVGRPGISIEINPKGGVFIGVEIGIERLALWVVDLAGEEIGREIVAFDTASVAPEVTVQRVGELVRRVCESFVGEQGIVRGLGVALPALVDKAGVVINGFVLRWRDFPLRQMLETELRGVAGDFPIAVENDANAFGVATLWRSPDLLRGTVACLTMENGVGGAIFHEGQLFRGADGYAGEFGHLLLAGDWPSSGAHVLQAQSGRPPAHFENHIGKDAVLAHYRQLTGDTSSAWSELLAACYAGQPLAADLLRPWAAKLAQGLTQVSVILNPRCFVLGGSVAPLFECVAAEVSAAIRRELLYGFPIPEIRVSPLGEDGTPLGAALLMHRRFFSVDEPHLPKAPLS